MAMPFSQYGNRHLSPPRRRLQPAQHTDAAAAGVQRAVALRLAGFLSAAQLKEQAAQGPPQPASAAAPPPPPLPQSRRADEVAQQLRALESSAERAQGDTSAALAADAYASRRELALATARRLGIPPPQPRRAASPAAPPAASPDPAPAAGAGEEEPVAPGGAACAPDGAEVPSGGEGEPPAAAPEPEAGAPEAAEGGGAPPDGGAAPAGGGDDGAAGAAGAAADGAEEGGDAGGAARALSGAPDEPEEVARLKADLLAAFRAFDADGSGTVTEEELQAVVQQVAGAAWSDEEVASVMAAADRNGDGVISYTEFVAAAMSLPLPPRPVPPPLEEAAAPP
eukprot:TRINITY_DN4506_c0_g1_i1.p1 TRINITY_DN4506_c0_g1~~TRINITY_DN4506_c0_g1_i1.p1  ORF type:complete len:366 (+),score=77.55 TRINITY_DN4506_c0_g1_i1:83-1099(+)